MPSQQNWFLPVHQILLWTGVVTIGLAMISGFQVHWDEASDSVLVHSLLLRLVFSVCWSIGRRTSFHGEGERYSE